MQKIVAVLLLCFSITHISAMKKPEKRMYPLLDIPEQQFSQAQEEQAPLLSHDALAMPITYPMHLLQTDKTAEPNSLLYISKTDSEKELAELRSLLSAKEQMLEGLPTSFEGTLQRLHKNRSLEHGRSNAIVGTIGCIYYLITMCVNCAEPNMLVPDDQNPSKNRLRLLTMHNLLGTMGSEVFALQQSKRRDHTLP